jgi:hypothetical protein
VADLPPIQGKTPDSINEVYIAQALDKLKIDYIFQAMPFGVGVAGAFIVDFVVFNPFETPVEIYGRYWHTGQLGADDALRLAIVEKHYGRAAVIIWDDESDTAEKALQIVRQKLD